MTSETISYDFGTVEAQQIADKDQDANININHINFCIDTRLEEIHASKNISIPCPYNGLCDVANTLMDRLGNL